MHHCAALHAVPEPPKICQPRNSSAQPCRVVGRVTIDDGQIVVNKTIPDSRRDPATENHNCSLKNCNLLFLPLVVNQFAALSRS